MERKKVFCEGLRGFRRKAGALAAAMVLGFPGAAANPSPGEELAFSVGDSIAAGFGNPPYQQGTSGPENQCYRSEARVAADMLAKKVINIACQGASLNDITKGHMYNEAQSQLERMKSLIDLGYKPDVIFFSGGINERSLADLFEGCLGQMSCDIQPDIESGVRSTFISRPFRNKLKNTYQQILELAPDATLVIPGYSSPIGDGVPWELIPKDFPIEAVAKAPSLVLGLNRAIDDINRTLEAAVHELGDERVIYVDPPPIGEPWRILEGNFHLDTSRWTFGHPTETGQIVIGLTAKRALDKKNGVPVLPVPVWLYGNQAVLPKRPRLRGLY